MKLENRPRIRSSLMPIARVVIDRANGRPPQRSPANALPCMAAKPCSSSTSQAGLAAAGGGRVALGAAAALRAGFGEVRYVLPFFCDPDHDTMIECLSSCRPGGEPAKYPPISVGDYALWFARRSYEHMAHEPALPDAVVAPGVRTIARW